MKLKVMTLVFLLGIVGRVDATFMSGDALIPYCEGKFGEQGHLLCGMYLFGASDGATSVAGEDAHFCMPEQVKMEQLRRIFIKYVADNPHELHASASSIVLVSLIEAFPCK